MRKGVIKFVIFLLMTVSLYFFIPSGKNQNCETMQRFFKLSIYGFVQNKYIDRHQHSFPFIIINEIKDNKMDTLNFFLDESGLFDEINEHDTLYKAPESLEIFFIKNGEKKHLGTLDFECEQKK